MGSWLQVGGTGLALFSAVVIMLQNNEQSDASTQLQIKIYQHESERQIKNIQDATEKQIGVIQEESRKSISELQASTQRQIQVIQENTALQMEHLSSLTNKQIETHREESKKQRDNFVEQTEEITDRLEGVAEQLAVLAKLSGELVETERELKKIEELKLKQREEELRKKESEFLEAQERTKPIILFRLEADTEFLFWNYLFVHIYNGGGDAVSISFTIKFKNSYTKKVKSYTQTFTNLRRSNVVKFKAGRVKNLKDYDFIAVESSAWDVQHREYYAHRWWNRIDDTWLQIDADERRLLGN